MTIDDVSAAARDVVICTTCISSVLLSEYVFPTIQKLCASMTSDIVLCL